MKRFAVLVSLLLSSSAFAAVLNLTGGETAVIEANTRTTVSCNAAGGGTVDCAKAVAGFQKIMEYCYKSLSGGECAKKHWPKFRDANPGCAYEGTDTCIEYCYKSHNGSTCADLCQ